MPSRVWQLAGIAMVVCLLSFLFWVFGPAGDVWDALKVPAYGAILVVPFLHCWYLKGRFVMNPSVAEEAAG